MALGPVESRRFPYLSLSIATQTRSFQVEALIDTGFDGDVTLPAALVADLLPEGVTTVRLADGSSVLAPTYFATIQIGHLAPIRGRVIVIGDTPLIGLWLIERYRVILDRGQRVVVEP